MPPERDTPQPGLEQQVRPGVQVRILTRPSHRELFITGMPEDGKSGEAVRRAVADVLRDNDARIVSLDVFGGSPGGDETRMLSEALGGVSCPVTWIEGESPAARGIGGVHVWAVTRVPVEPLELDGRIVGSVFEDDHARYCRLSGLVPADSTEPREQQARGVFERMEATLRNAGMDFSDVLRTWFFNDAILSWYQDFNRVRDAFFRQQRAYDGVLPASTGVGAQNAFGAALIGGLLAVRGKSDEVRAAAIPSPLQQPAIDYGSSFSRAVELVMPDCRQLFVSGTASIAGDGDTAHIGDVDAQITLTMDVVEAILESRGMNWTQVTRAVAYFRRADDVPAFRRCCAHRKIAPLPVVCAQSTICRDELLFELEVDAVANAGGRGSRGAGVEP
jgi:enamine deaminase RidA (YjgF/YER057c/UK114 family)